MTSVAETLAEGTALLRDSSDSPRADALLLLAHALQRGREWIVAHGDATPSAKESEAFQRLSAKRCLGVPVAYLLGSAGFYGREFVVNENVLVPRPETEHLVNEAIRFIGDRPLHVLDVGTGSGAIACTLAAETPAIVRGTDISPAAVTIANENARRTGVADRCRFYVGDLTEPVRAQRFDLVVANLPYVPTAEISAKPDPVAYEPREALDGGPDGLALYRRVLATLAPLLNPNALILLEAAPPTMPGLAAIAKSALPYSGITVGRDYAGLDRYLRIGTV
ncbi:MAG TPA: peptide chain release factor N(5)-glutamine methyltransferase [Candidatus Cybelea sp.]|nr:peptide chain release factor N(5)-glutamine methyltransferase [Candidatus Cybelea sp.]